MIVIRAADLRPTPWPNGAGITRAITGNVIKDGWMLGVADLSGDAPFSHFPDCDRIFTLLEGTPSGVTLQIEGAGLLSCHRLVPSCFPGDRPTLATMPNQPARAFNFVFDRRRFAGQVTVRAMASGHPSATATDVFAIFCATGRLMVGNAMLASGDTCLLESAVTIRAMSEETVAISVERWAVD